MRERLYGWGRTSPSLAEVVTPTSEDEVLQTFTSAQHVLARGLGRSYGDAAQAAGGVVMRNDGFDSMSSISSDGLITVGSGVSIDDIIRVGMPQGWFVPVTPGTRQVSIGGAIAADVHGKNHHVDGSFASHVRHMRIATPVGIMSCSAEEQPELFWATVGGMGLTGFILDATVQLLPIESDAVLVDTVKHRDLDGVMADMLENDHRYRYSVSWVDCMTKGTSMGRGIITRGDHAPSGEDDITPPRGARITVPLDAPSGLLNPLSIRIFNELWFRRAPKKRDNERQSIGTFFHPLDGVNDWNRLYGRRGFVQYQFAVPDAATETVRRAIETLSGSGVPSFLAVLKRFGEGNMGHLSFPTPGWTLALDLPVGPPALPGVLDALDTLVLENGGRVYLAKDSRLDPASFRAMYPRYQAFLSVKASVDPRNVITSDLARRLELVAK